MKNNKRYLTIYEQVREDIITKRYHKGAKLPSKRVMAERMDVSLITVEHAYELLLEEGYIASKEKSGYFVIFDEKDISSASPSHKEDHVTKVPVSSPPPEPSGHNWTGLHT